MSRAKWIRYGLKTAKDQASNSKDPSTQVGACVLRPEDYTVASLGWNGFARGVEETPARLGDRAVRLAFTIHAEENAIINSHESLRGHSMFVWPFMPCMRCASRVIQAGIKCVYAPNNIPERWRDDMEAAQGLFREAGVALTLVDDV